MPIFGKILGQPLPYLIMPGAVGWRNRASVSRQQSATWATDYPATGSLAKRLLPHLSTAPHVIFQIDKWHGVLARPLPHVIFKIEQ